MKEEKIKFKQLSIWLKLGTIGGIAALVIYVVSFLIGFIEGVLEVA